MNNFITKKHTVVIFLGTVTVTVGKAEEKVKELTDLLEQLKAKKMETKDLVIQPPQQYR